MNALCKIDPDIACGDAIFGPESNIGGYPLAFLVKEEMNLGEVMLKRL